MNLYFLSTDGMPQGCFYTSSYIDAQLLTSKRSPDAFQNIWFLSEKILWMSEDWGRNERQSWRLFCKQNSEWPLLKTDKFNKHRPAK